MTRWPRAIGLSLFALFVLPIGCSDDDDDGGGSLFPPVVLFDAQTGALHAHPDMATNGAGDAVAVWTESPLDGSPRVSRVLGAVYSQASGTWSTGAELALNAAAPRVATNGTGFMAVWIVDDAGLVTVEARAYGAGGWDASATVLHTTFDTVEGIRIASNGTGYGVVWSERGATASRIYASLYSGAAWDASATALDGGGAWAGGPAIAGKASSEDYAVAWIQENAAGTEWRVYSALHATTPAWGSAAESSIVTGEAGTCSLASNGSGYLLAWSQVDGSADWSIYADIHNGAVWGGAADVDVTSDDCDRPDVASNGTGYVVAWRRFDTTGDLHNIEVLRHVGTGWAGAGVEAVETSAVDAGAPRAASDGTNYALAWTGLDGTLRNLYASFFDGATWGAPAAVESGAGACREGGEDLPVVRGNGTARYEFAWSQLESAAADAVLTVYGRAYTGTWGAQSDLVGAAWDSGAVRPRVAVNDAGDAMVVWQQYRNGVAGIWARLRSGSSWGAPVSLGQPGEMPAVATDGTGFMAAWSDPDTGIVAREYAGGMWDASETTVDARPGSPVLASNGTTYGLVWGTAALEIHAAVYNAGWGAAATLATAAREPRLAADGTEYVALGLVESGGVEHLITWAYAAAWSAGSQLDTGGTSVSGPEIVAGGSSCGAVWAQGGQIHAAFRTVGAWAGAARIDTSAAPVCSRPAIAASDTGYAAIWQQGADVYALRADGTTWQVVPKAIDAGAGAAVYPRIASDGAGYAATWLQFDGTYETLLVRECSSGGIWRSIYALERWGGDVEPDHVVARDGNGYLSLWSQVDPSDPVRRLVRGQSF